MIKREYTTVDGETVTRYIPESPEDVEGIRETVGEDALDTDPAFSQSRDDRPTRTCIDCGAERPAGETVNTEHGPVCRADCNEDE